jgi:hypothetical protein
MNKIEFISNNKIKITALQLLELEYPDIISQKYCCDFSIRINDRLFFNCGDDSFTLMEFLQAVARWAYRKDNLFYNSIETEDNPLISFAKEEDGLYSIHSPWQLFECKEHFNFEQLLCVLDLAKIKLNTLDNEMCIEKDGYRFLVDIERTKEYYKAQELCECIGCRNYYAQVKKQLPQTSSFLSEFGVDIERPDEIGWYDTDERIEYISADFTVCGKMLKNSDFIKNVDDNQNVRMTIYNETLKDIFQILKVVNIFV